MRKTAWKFSRAFELSRHHLGQRFIPRWLDRLGVQRARARQRAPQSGQQRTIYVDLAVISRDDAGTGIQRVVRALALALSQRKGSDWKLQFVAATRKRRYHHISWPSEFSLIDHKSIIGKPGDIFIGLDYSLDTVRWYRKQLQNLRRNGVAFWFLIHDLLPVQHPEWFSRNTVIRYRAWLKIIAGLADGFLCNSTQTETHILKELGDTFGRSIKYKTAVLPMGHDIRHSFFDSRVNSFKSAEIRSRFPQGNFILAVGTIEPRKGHTDLIAAFDIIWKRGSDMGLVLIGRLGWHVDELQTLITTHPQAGNKLVWLNDAGDSELLAAYGACKGVIIASHGEGYGLPLIEALGQGKAVLARDLPIFREHEANGVRFFPKDAAPEDIANHIDGWIVALRSNQISITAPQTSWEASARLLIETVLSN